MYVLAYVLYIWKGVKELVRSRPDEEEEDDEPEGRRMEKGDSNLREGATK